jgi:hypothetical protein
MRVRSCVHDVCLSAARDAMDAMCSYGEYWGRFDNLKGECYASARAMQYAVWLELLSTVFLGASFYEILENRRNVTPRLCAVYVSTAILGAGLMTIIPSATDMFRPLQMWCWIESASPETISSAALQWAFYYAELSTAFLVLVVVTALPLRRWRRIRRDADKKQLAVRMMLFPAVWLVCKVPSIVDRAYELITGDVLPGLAFVHSLTIPTMGFFDAIMCVCVCGGGGGRMMRASSCAGVFHRGIIMIACVHARTQVRVRAPPRVRVRVRACVCVDACIPSSQVVPASSHA